MEKVNHPQHYGGENNVYEAIKVIEAWGLGFHLGNTIKYVARAGKKPHADELEDLRKAKWYLERRIEQVERVVGESKASLDRAASDPNKYPLPDLGSDPRYNKNNVGF